MNALNLFLSLFVFASLSVICWFAIRPPRCPRCGCREWVPLQHRGPYVAYCRSCTLVVDMSNGTTPK